MLAITSAAALVAGCGIFSTGPTPSPAPTADSSAGTSISTATAKPSKTPSLVGSVTLIAQIGDPADWTPAGVTWHGIQAGATQVGATSSLITYTSNAELPADIERASTGTGAVVITVGPDPDTAVRAAALAHPTTQYFEMDVVVPSSAPGNVHGLVFDEAEAGYLGGFVAASFSAAGHVGFVGDVKSDARSTNYAAGFQGGATEARTDAETTLAYAGNPDAPAAGRTAAKGLISAGNDVVMAMSGLSGIAALRQACSGEVKVVALETDAWHTIPDIGSCLITSILKRYDNAASTAILAAASGSTMPRLLMNDVSNGGIALGSFHTDLPAGFQTGLDAVMATLQIGPPRATAAPPTAPPSAKPSASK
ncbi:MAG TPA: BMP family ABC transporter substrate-binding protein [Candidatus Limnocylindrales bacterium]